MSIKTILNPAKLHREDDQFYISDPPWMIYVVLLVVCTVFGGLGILFLQEGDGNVAGYVCIALSVLCFLFLFLNPNGKEARRFKGKLQWGAGKEGIFLMSSEQRISHYDWPRIRKIVLVEKLTYPEQDGIWPVEGIIGLNEIGSVTALNKVRLSDIILFYVDDINESETKIGKIIHDRVSQKAEAIAKSYGVSDADNIIDLLRIYAPKNLTIERVTELQLD